MIYDQYMAYRRGPSGSAVDQKPLASEFAFNLNDLSISCCISLHSTTDDGCSLRIIILIHILVEKTLHVDLPYIWARCKRKETRLGRYVEIQPS